jgi:hypothetical protein
MMNTLPEAVGSQETQQMDFRLIIASSCLFVAACASPGLHEPSRDIDKPERTGRERMRRLLDGMVTSGLMSIDYDDSATKTAPQTFHDRPRRKHSTTGSEIACRSRACSSYSRARLASRLLSR